MPSVSVPTRRPRSRPRRRCRDGIRTADRLLASIHRWDPRTAEHCRRVADLATAFARTIHFSAERVRLVRTAALLHDVGKVTIPRRILRKPGTLTAAERRILDLHAPRGQAILRLRPLPREIADIVRFHHQHYDGNGGGGGPRRGAAIPLVSRMLAIVDAYEAMTGDRTYRRPVSHDRACLELKCHAGRQFDPALVADFLRAFGPH